MKNKFLNNYLAVIVLMVLFTAGAIIVAKYVAVDSLYIQKEPTDASSAIFGIGALSIVPLMLCLFGLSEFNSMFVRLAKSLGTSERDRLITEIDEQYNRCWKLSFITIALQVFCTLFLLFPTYDSPLALLCPLVNSIFCVWVYGVYVCESVREAASFSEKQISGMLTREERDRAIEEIKKSMPK